MLHSKSSAIKNRLKEALRNALPGEKAHRRILLPGRDLYPAAGKESTIQSSVLVLIFPVNEKLHTCFIRRPATMRNHGGQIAFPGGRYEPEDKDLIRTALRESNEEIGTDEKQIEILGALSPIYVDVSNFTINPFVGWCETKPEFKIDQREADELLIVPIENFLLHSAYQLRKINTIRGTVEAPGFYIDPLFIWGATGMIVSEFNEIYHSITDQQSEAF